MTTEDDKGKQGDPSATAGTPGGVPPVGEAATPEGPSSELRQNIERALRQVLEDRFGKSLQADDLAAGMKQLPPGAGKSMAMSMVGAVLRSVGQAADSGQLRLDQLKTVASQRAAEKEGKRTEAEAEVMAPPLLDQLQTALKGWAEKLENTLSKGLHDSLGLPLTSEGKLDQSALEDDQVLEGVAKRLQGMADRLQVPLDEAMDRAFKVISGGTKPSIRAYGTAKRGEAAAPVGEAAAEQAQAEQAAEAGAEPSTVAETATTAESAAPTAVDTADGAATDESAGGSEPDATAAAGEGVEEGGDNVVDLEKFRKMLQDRQGAAAFKLGESLRETIQNFLESRAQPESGGTVKLNVDQDFFREHGASILGQALQGLYKAIVPPKIELNLPAAGAGQEGAAAAPVAEGGGEEGASGQAEAGGTDSGVKVSLNLDLASLFGRWLKPKGEPPAGK